MGTSVPVTEDKIENINCLFSNLDTKISIHLSLRNELVIDVQHMSLFFTKATHYNGKTVI